MFHNIRKSITITLSAVMILVLGLSFVLFFVSEIGIVKAEPKTIVVPDDYFTITAAIGNASEGDTVFVKKGTYEEHSLVINKTLTLVGEDANNTTIKNIDKLHWDPSIPFLPPLIVAVQINANTLRSQASQLPANTVLGHQ